MWNQVTSKDGIFDPQTIALFKDVSVLSFGSRCFRLTASPALRRLNCFRVDVQGTNPLVVVHKLTELIEQVIKESMKGLSMMLLLPKLDGTHSNLDCIRLLEQSDDSNSLTLLSLTAVKKAVDSNNGLIHKAKTIISFDDLKRYCSCWLQVYSAKARYDLFISYRWGEFDQPLARQIFDAMSNYSLLDRNIDVFLDVLRLKGGQQFDKEFVRALVNSKVILPLLTMDGVAKFRSHTGEFVDNVLLEWILAYECNQANSRDPTLSRVQFVYPLFVGRRRKLNESNSLHIEPFDYNFYSQFPDVVPEATIAKAKELLIANDIKSFSDHFETWTVRSFIAEFKSFLGMKASEYKQVRLISSVANDVYKVLQQASYSRPSTVESTTVQNRPSSSSSSGVATKLRNEVLNATAPAPTSIDNFDLAWEILQVKYIICIYTYTCTYSDTLVEAYTTYIHFCMYVCLYTAIYAVFFEIHRFCIIFLTLLLLSFEFESKDRLTITILNTFKCSFRSC
jgi:hypothetical protein